jgi:predicted lysophospholipase L1 biosynthesis ABC-type transport system permease subunit
MFADIALIAAAVCFYMALRTGADQRLHDLVHLKVDGSRYLAGAVVFAIAAFFLK